MKKIIKGRIYNTDTSKLLSFKYVGEFGDAHGYEERLYVTLRGQYFLFGIGGPNSPYAKETIKPIAKEEADAWEAEATKSIKKDNAKTAKIKKPRKRPVKKTQVTQSAAEE